MVTQRDSGRVRSTGVTLLLIAAVFALGALIANFVVMPLVVHERTSVIVPDLRNLSEQQARETAERMRLDFRVDRRENSGEVPEGFVVSQRPRPDDTVKEGRTVSVVLSLGRRTQRVPVLKDATLRQGQILLAQQRLNPGRMARVMMEGGSGEIVLSCSPPSGREVAEGSDVSLLVGVRGRPRSFLMPDLTGQDLLFVKDKLEKFGFRTGNVRYERRGNVYPNTVIDQSPKPGVMIREGDSIELVAAGSG